MYTTIVGSWGGLGDQVMLMPALRKYKQLNQETTLVLAALKRQGEGVQDLLYKCADVILPVLPDAWDWPSYTEQGIPAVKKEIYKIADQYTAKGVKIKEVFCCSASNGDLVRGTYKFHKIFRFAMEMGIEFDSFKELKPVLYHKNSELVKKIRTKHVVVHIRPNVKTKQPTNEMVQKIREEIKSKFPNHRVYEFGSHEIGEEISLNNMDLTKALVATAAHAYCADSAVMHIAGAFNTPTTSLWTSTPVCQAAPFYIDNHEIISLMPYERDRLFFEEIKQLYR